MIEQFYSIDHLTTNELRDLYDTYRPQGWVDYEYYDRMIEGVTPPTLSDNEIMFNIDAASDRNYFVYMEGMEEEEDGVMIGFGLTEYPSYGVYLHLHKKLLKDIVKKYNLTKKNGGREWFPFTKGNLN
ncbi:hypothetical protein [Bacteroides sp. 224]|uniref:hypothetical protein n=1 Tax=Bacteroides sp. 224 TaxID=2302936 RepID=UPI0013D64A5B|nr:hypothetical protein [Bacteroides sp. 224]NDV64640.1 hypothetical protein [Bacteroides sp. 224]